MDIEQTQMCQSMCLQHGLASYPSRSVYSDTSSRPLSKKLLVLVIGFGCEVFKVSFSLFALLQSSLSQRSRTISLDFQDRLSLSLSFFPLSVVVYPLSGNPTSSYCESLGYAQEADGSGVGLITL